MKKPPEHPRADDGYSYGEPADIVGGRVMNADVDGVYIVVGEKRFVVCLNGQDWPVVRYK